MLCLYSNKEQLIIGDKGMKFEIGKYYVEGGNCDFRIYEKKLILKGEKKGDYLECNNRYYGSLEHVCVRLLELLTLENDLKTIEDLKTLITESKAEIIKTCQNLPEYKEFNK